MAAVSLFFMLSAASKEEEEKRQLSVDRCLMWNRSTSRRDEIFIRFHHCRVNR
jgi:hypothetical protein